MLKCKNCIHLVINDKKSNIGCSKGGAIVSGVDLEAAKQGLFMWPYDFDPKWAKNCIGFIDSKEELFTLNKKELKSLFEKEINWIKTMTNNKFEFIHPYNLEKVEKNYFIFLDKLDSLDDDFDRWNDKEIIDIINIIRQI